jgi:large subunit ribosomal protein L23
MIFADKKNKVAKATTEVKSVNSVKTENVKKAKPAYSYRVTEKAARLGDNNTYIFNILEDKNKIEIRKELEIKYKVKVININIVNSPRKKVFSRGRAGVKSGFKKAYITLKKGDSIAL